MAYDDDRFYQTLYGIETDDWEVNFGTFANHNKLLVSNYISDACSTTDSSTATAIHMFIFPHHLKKTYFIEGEAEGQVTFAASECTATLYAYRVTICKVRDDNTDTELFSTGWVIVDDTLEWDSTYSVGEEMVYPFWIDCWNEEILDEHDRIYIKVETDTSTCTESSCSCAVLYHTNDATYEDIKITIPLRL